MKSIQNSLEGEKNIVPEFCSDVPDVRHASSSLFVETLNKKERAQPEVVMDAAAPVDTDGMLCFEVQYIGIIEENLFKLIPEKFLELQ